MLDYAFDANDAKNLTVKALDTFYNEAAPSLSNGYRNVEDLPMSAYRQLASAMTTALIAYEKGKQQKIADKNEYRSLRDNAQYHPKIRSFIVEQMFMIKIEQQFEMPEVLTAFEESDF